MICSTTQTRLPQLPDAPFTSTQNACKLCTPLGACLAFAGIEGARTVLHGSQGCATYIRRYMISHFKEPIDIASSNFGEQAAIFGGRENLRVSLQNVSKQYEPRLIGVATTCLSETIGDDVGMFLKEIERETSAEGRPVVVPVSTPAYAGTHAEGFHAAVRAVIEQLAEPGEPGKHVNLFPGMCSPSDLRYLREVLEDFDLPTIVTPDYSDTLDGPTWDQYHLIPRGGTSIQQIQQTARAKASIELSQTNDASRTAGCFLEEQHSVPRHRLPLPIGVAQTDELFAVLERLTGQPTPEKHQMERGRLIDSFVDGHKYLFDKRAVVFGEEDLVVGMAGLLAEIGMVPIVCASGGKSGKMQAAIEDLAPDLTSRVEVLQGVDFVEIEKLAEKLRPDLLIGHSKGYTMSRRLGIPLIRIGFPIHDRVGGARILHLGYRGTQQLFDRITNALIETTQADSSVGYTYM